jgi:D-3-phosphoglycerate dehydrogenase / 2-oxoglutarate reductase
MKHRVLITCRQLQESIDEYRPLFAEKGIRIDLPPVVQQLSEAELLNIIDRYDGVIAGDDPFTARVIDRAQRLKIIAKWGIGTDAIDIPHARARGVLVQNTPDVFADEVADVVMGYAILLARQLHRLDIAVRAGEWLKVRGTTLRGRVMGVVGVGSIGRAVVRRARACGMVVVGTDVASVVDGFMAETALELMERDELLARSDFIALCCNLTPENRHLLSWPEFDRMRAGVRIINAARGPLIDEAALVAALESGRVAGAALDVFEVEPLPFDSPLRHFDQCIFGTHNASNTVEAVRRVNELAIENLLRALDERP